MLFQDILRSELEDGRRVLFENALGRRVPALLRALRLRVLRGAARNARQPGDDVVRRAARSSRRRSSALLVRYDNLWQMSFPYVLTLHQAPTDGGDYSGFHFHIECHPPLRKPHLLKYLAGPEIGGGNFLSDTLARSEGGRAARAARRPLPSCVIRGRCSTPFLALARPRCATRSWPRPSAQRRIDGRGGSRRRRATRSTRSTSSANRSSSASPRRSRAIGRSCWWPKGCRADAVRYPDGVRRSVRRLADHRRSDRRHARPDVSEAQRVDPDGGRAQSWRRHVAARHRAGGADGDSAGEAAPCPTSCGRCAAAGRRRSATTG